MKTSSRHSVTKLLLACAAFAILLSACAPVSAATLQPTVPPTLQPTAAPLPTQPPSVSSNGITLGISDLFTSLAAETIPAVPATADSMWWAVGPEYRGLTLQGYPVAAHDFKAKIFVYPAASLAAANEAAGKAAAALQALLQTHQAGDELPFLPLINAKQVLHSQVQFLDFKNGKGVRFVTQFNQGFVKINNLQLIYTFQGLTSDGKYYIAAVLPLTHPELPATEEIFTKNSADLLGYLPYVKQTAGWLDQQKSGSFSPDLAKLDALVQSIEVK